MESAIFSSVFYESDESDDESRRRKRKIYKTRINNIELWDDEEFIDRFRVSKDVVAELVDLIGDRLKTRTEKNFAIKPVDQVLVALQYYASSSFMRCVGDMAGIHKSTVCRIVHKVSHEIARLREHYIKLPESNAEKTRIATAFYNIARFPKVLGTIDCTHVGVLSLGGTNAEDFRNRKSLFSVNVQVVADANLCIQNVVARWPGSAHDSHIFNSSNLKYRLESGEFGDYWLLGDSGYGLQPYLLTPLANPVAHKERLYNESQIRTRNTVERLFGVWKRRFPILGGKIRCKLPRFQPIIVATAVLHNLCRKYNVREPADNNSPVVDMGVDPVPVVDTQSNAGQNVRQELIDTYFGR